jgi:hypothetical protein
MNLLDKNLKNLKFLGKVKKKISSRLYNIYFKATEFHFEKRDKLNGIHPTFEEATSVDTDWILLDRSMSIYHDNKIGKNEMKFVHPNGREAVFDGDTLEPVIDPRYKATYNYVPPTNIPENKLNPIEWIIFIIKGTGHFIMDVLPYYLTGKRNERNQKKDRKE